VAGQRDNTLVILVSDNGASGDGGPDGSVNDMLFANGVPDRLSHKRVFLGEGIMLELISPVAAIQPRSSACRRRIWLRYGGR